MSTPASPLTAQPDPAAEEVLERRLRGSLLAEELRRLSDRPVYAHYRATLLSCINTVLIEAARTPEKDRARVLKALKEFGGGTLKDTAVHARLPQIAVREIIERLITERTVEVRRRPDLPGADALLYFLTGDASAEDFLPA